MASGSLDFLRLTALAREPDSAVGPLVLRVQAELFASVARHDPAAIAAFEALALGFVPKVDDATAALVARLLAGHPETPKAVLEALSRRGGEAARIVMGHSATPPETALLSALAEAPESALAIAMRPDLSPAVIASLVAREDARVDRALARNQAIALGGHTLAELTHRARSRRPLATALLAREDLPVGDAASLYLLGEPEQRARIRHRLAESQDPGHPVMAVARPSAEQVEPLLAAAAAGDLVVFGSRLAALLGLDRVPAWRFDSPETREFVALALLAAGVGEEECVRVFLTLRPEVARSVETVFALTAMVRATPRSVATRVVEAVLDQPVGIRRQGRHQPLAAPGGTPSRAATFGLRRDPPLPVDGRREAS